MNGLVHGVDLNGYFDIMIMSMNLREDGDSFHGLGTFGRKTRACGEGGRKSGGV